jgi:hypothetical protein
MVSDGRPLIHHKRELVSCIEVGLELLLAAWRCTCSQLLTNESEI